MRAADILGLAISSLWQQKARSLLTMLGVVFGSFVLAASLSIEQGVQDTIHRESHRSDSLRRIHVGPQWRRTAELPADEQVPGTMSDAKRQRIRQAIAERKQRFSPNNLQVPLTQEKLQALADLDHVEAVVPVVWSSGFAILEDRAQLADVASARPDSADHRQRLVAGRFFAAAAERTVVVSEFLLYRLGITDDAAVAGVLGQKLRLEFRFERQEAGFAMALIKPDGGLPTRDEAAALDKVRSQLPAALDRLDLTAAEKEVLRQAVQARPAKALEAYSEEFTIIGVVRLPTAEEQREPWDPLLTDADVLLPAQTATDLFFRVPGPAARSLDQAVVIVDREENVKEVSRRIEELGLSSHNRLEFIKRERLMYLLIFGAMTCVAAVALIVAALGIANTMLMSVLERTREIGIMKAVGAGNGHLLLIFLLEGLLIGLFGGGLGLLLSWVISFPGDAWVRSIVSNDLKIELKESLFVFPFWLVLVVLLFAVAITTLAAVYPARRAAKVDPVKALRHE